MESARNVPTFLKKLLPELFQSYLENEGRNFLQISVILTLTTPVTEPS
jgi:hypothetical protein